MAKTQFEFRLDNLSITNCDLYRKRSSIGLIFRKPQYMDIDMDKYQDYNFHESV